MELYYEHIEIFLALLPNNAQHVTFRYIGDFAKFGLLRYILSGLPQLKLGVQWYKVPDEAHNNDGRHIDYLADNDEFRDCDPGLYHALNIIVTKGERTLAAVQGNGILPIHSISRRHRVILMCRHRGVRSIGANGCNSHMIHSTMQM